MISSKFKQKKFDKDFIEGEFEENQQNEDDTKKNK